MTSIETYGLDHGLSVLTLARQVRDHGAGILSYLLSALRLVSNRVAHENANIFTRRQCGGCCTSSGDGCTITSVGGRSVPSLPLPPSVASLLHLGSGHCVPKILRIFRCRENTQAFQFFPLVVVISYLTTYLTLDRLHHKSKRHGV